jgi:riboflavin synthase
MSTITDLESSTSGSASMGIINTNFDNLNTNKIKATQTVALTNKTIDGDLNTVQDLPYSALKSTSRTGSDTKVVTGTKGDTDELAKWNVDGDLVTTDVSITTTAPTSTSADTTLPTSQAVYEAIANESGGKQIFVPCLKHNADGEPYASSALNSYAVSQLDITEHAYFLFAVPSTFTSLTSIELIMIPDATETVQMDVTVHMASDGEVSTQHTGTESNTTKSVTSGNMTKWRIDNLAGTIFAPMSAGDIVGVDITSDITMLRVLGLLVKYT